MASVDVESEFWKLIQAANGLMAKARSINDDEYVDLVDENRMVEPTYLAICNLVRNHPEARPIFVRCFTELVCWKRESPWFLVPFCMRILRMPEIKAALRREMDERGIGTAAYASMMNYCSSVMHAYHDDVWEDAFMFDSFESAESHR